MIKFGFCLTGLFRAFDEGRNLKKLFCVIGELKKINSRLKIALWTRKFISLLACEPIGIFCVLCLISSLWFAPFVYGREIVQEKQSLDSIRPSWESRLYLIEGVHYLVNEADSDMAEELFRKAIFSSSFSSLSEETEDQDRHRWVVAEAFYFLGKISYEKSISGGNIAENIAWAKKYLEKAEEYGIVYDRLHPPLLDEINRKYPGIEVPISEPNRENAKTIIEFDHGSYQIDAFRVDKYADVIKSKFESDHTIDLECGARYKIKPDVQGKHKSIYGALSVFGIGVIIWITRG